LGKGTSFDGFSDRFDDDRFALNSLELNLEEYLIFSLSFLVGGVFVVVVVVAAAGVFFI
jgi:hypothetical protein